MLNLIIEVSRYVMILLFVVYTLQCFISQIGGLKKETRNHFERWQRIIIYLIHMLASNLIYIVTDDSGNHHKAYYQKHAHVIG